MKYLFNSDPQYLNVVVDEIIKIEDVQNHYDLLALSHFPQKDLKVLINCKNSRFRIQRDEIQTVDLAFKKALMRYNSIQEAIIVDKPYKTVIASLFEQYFPDHIKYLFKIFCTEEAALDWLLNN